MTTATSTTTTSPTSLIRATLMGAMYGVVFGVLASLTRIRGMALVAAAVVWVASSS